MRMPRFDWGFVATIIVSLLAGAIIIAIYVAGHIDEQNKRDCRASGGLVVETKRDVWACQRP